jgi:diguanylate cyclase
VTRKPGSSSWGRPAGGSWSRGSYGLAVSLFLFSGALVGLSWIIDQAGWPSSWAAGDRWVAVLATSNLSLGAGLLVVAHQHSRYRAVWSLGSTAVVALGAVWFIEGFFVRGGDRNSFPSFISLILGIIGGLCGYLGTLSYIALQIRVRLARHAADVAVSVSALACLAAAIVYPRFASATGSATVSVASISRLVVIHGVDLLIVAAVVTTLALVAGRPSLSLGCFAAAAVLLAIGQDQVLRSAISGTERLSGLGLALDATATLFVAAAAWTATDKESPEVDSLGIVVLPAMAGLFGVAVLVAGSLAPLPRLTVVLAVTTIGMVVVRGTFLLRDLRYLSTSRAEATTDELTQQPNRRALGRQVQAAFDLGQPFALMLIDLDGFKEINDVLGHSVGDAVLFLIGSRFADHCRGTDFVARLGGDEFAVLLPGIDNDSDARERASAVLGTLTEPVVLDGLPLAVRASAGVALAPRDGSTREELLRIADVAMYHAKEGRKDVEVYRSDRDSANLDRLVLSAHLRDALRDDQRAFDLTVVFQPLYDIASGRIVGAEALARWCHPERGHIPPSTFIALAERTGLMPELTNKVIDLALAEQAAWCRLGHDVTVSVNVSASSFLDRDLTQCLTELLVHHRVAADRVTLELTEHVLLADPDLVQGTLSELRDMGVGLSLDDFGTGYSPISFLRRLRIDELKIDRSFVAELPRSRADSAIVHRLIDLSHELDVRVVAEGVETEDGLRAIREWGCDLAQGFHLSKPLPGEQLRQLLQDPIRRMM